MVGFIFIDVTTPTKTWVSFLRYYDGTNYKFGYGYIQRTSALSDGFTTVFFDT